MDLNNNKLSSEDKETLITFCKTDAFRPVLRLLNLLAISQQETLLKMSLATSQDRDLALAKARAEGAEKLVSEFNRICHKPSKMEK
jgi:hypothetical protein